jgi:DNA-binding beta-propeller fold protein YncE
MEANNFNGLNIISTFFMLGMVVCGGVCAGNRVETAPNVLSLLAGNMNDSGNVDGTGTAATFNSPQGIAFDKLSGDVYVADTYNNTIRKITPDGVVSTFAGKAGVIGHADGKGQNASFNNPLGLATDSAGNVYVADSYNHAIRKITPSGVVTTIAGMPGYEGFAPGVLPGRLDFPMDVVVHGSLLYITMNHGVAVVQLQ